MTGLASLRTPMVLNDPFLGPFSSKRQPELGQNLRKHAGKLRSSLRSVIGGVPLFLWEVKTDESGMLGCAPGSVWSLRCQYGTVVGGVTYHGCTRAGQESGNTTYRDRRSEIPVRMVPFMPWRPMPVSVRGPVLTVLSPEASFVL